MRERDCDQSPFAMDPTIQPYDRLVGYAGNLKDLTKTQWYKEKVAEQAGLIAKAHQAASNQRWENLPCHRHRVAAHQSHQIETSRAQEHAPSQPQQAIASQAHEIAAHPAPRTATNQPPRIVAVTATQNLPRNPQSQVAPLQAAVTAMRASQGRTTRSHQLPSSTAPPAPSSP